MDENLKDDPRDEEQDIAQDDSSTDTTDSPEEEAERPRPPRPDAAEWERLMDK